MGRTRPNEKVALTQTGRTAFARRRRSQCTRDCPRRLPYTDRRFVHHQVDLYCGMQRAYLLRDTAIHYDCCTRKCFEDDLCGL